MCPKCAGFFEWRCDFLKADVCKYDVALNNAAFDL